MGQEFARKLGKLQIQSARVAVGISLGHFGRQEYDQQVVVFQACAMAMTSVGLGALSLPSSASKAIDEYNFTNCNIAVSFSRRFATGRRRR